MSTGLNLFIGAIVILIIFIIYYANSIKIYDQLISGFYEADDSFCEESGIDMLSIYLDENKNGSRACYILMTKSGQFILNEPTTAKLYMHSWNWSNWSLDPTKEKVFSIEFDDPTSSIEEIFPTLQTIKFYPLSGKLVMSSDDTIHAVLYKSGINSDMKQLVDDEEKEKEKEKE